MIKKSVSIWLQRVINSSQLARKERKRQYHHNGWLYALLRANTTDDDRMNREVLINYKVDTISAQLLSSIQLWMLLSIMMISQSTDLLQAYFHQESQTN
jgi:hypothetical protein